MKNSTLNPTSLGSSDRVKKRGFEGLPVISIGSIDKLVMIRHSRVEHVEISSQTGTQVP